VFAYYQLEGDPAWTAVPLTYVADISQYQAFFNGTIALTSLQGQETTFYIMVNASDILGLEASSGVTPPITVDNLAPKPTAITVEGGVPVENVTLITSEVNITAEFTDLAGVSSVYIYYSLPNGTTPLKMQMANTTATAPGVSPLNFFVTLPPANETTFVEYFFETTDYFGNSGNSSINFYYADGMAPSLDTLLIHPSYISNYSDATLLFNASDYSGISSSIVWYTLDGGATWNITTASKINYNKYIATDPTFSSENVPFLIKDNNTTYLSLEVVRGGGVDSAELTVELTHENPTDLRIWLQTDDGRRFLIFDREPGPTSITRLIDLIDLGFDESDFDNGTFTLEMQDFSDMYSGTITTFQIKLIHYKIPTGYQFIAAIPATGTDMTVSYFITLTDMAWNAMNTSAFTYYSDGLAPNISVPELPSPLDVSGGHSIRIVANVTDVGGLLGVDIYYKFSESANWRIDSMTFDSQTNQYAFDIPLSTANGTVIYKIRAFDLAGLTSETPIYTIEFVNAEIETSEGPAEDFGGLIIGGLVFLLVLGGIGSGVIYLLRRRSRGSLA
jgi:subtilisin-like proprotein convertase family protein